MGERGAQLAVSAGILVIGIAFAIGTYLLPEAAGYARVGPRLFPGLISTGLIVVGALLLWEAATKGFPSLPEEQREPFNWPAFAWVSGGLILHMLLIAGLGFILCSTLLFAAAARGMASVKPWRDIGLGLVTSVVVYVLFTQALTLSLPWGAWLPELP